MTNIADGEIRDFGIVAVNGSTSLVFTIKNLGVTDTSRTTRHHLNESGQPAVSRSMPLLCREQLHRIQTILDRAAGQPVTVREFARTYSIWRWELEEAARLGWLQLAIRKPPVGRPSCVATAIGKNQPQNYPPWRSEIPREISARHWQFAFRFSGVLRGPFGLQLATGVLAYLQTYQTARSRTGAAASACRLLRHPSVRAVRAWLHCETQGTVPRGERMPGTAKAIWTRLVALGAANISYTTRCSWRPAVEVVSHDGMPV